MPGGQCSLFEDDPFFCDSEHTEEQSTATITYTVVCKLNMKKRNDSFRDGIETEEIHHHPANMQCDCCLGQMTEAGTIITRNVSFLAKAVFIFNQVKVNCMREIFYKEFCG